METKTNFLDTYNLATSFDVVLDDNLHLLQGLEISSTDIICLAGGIPCEGIANGKIFIRTLPNSGIDFYLQSPELQVKCTMDFDDMTIDNELIKTEKCGNGLGLRLLLTQIEAARKHHFRRIELYAMGGSDWGFDAEWNGYYTWGRLGFLMEQNSYERFKGWAYDTHSGLQCLHEVLDEEWGREAWKKSGFSRDGYFELAEGSQSLAILKKYMDKRGVVKHL